MDTSLTENRKESAHEPRHHQETDEEQQRSADDVDDPVVSLDKVKCVFQLVDQQRTDYEWDPQTEGIAEQHEDADEGTSLLRGQQERRTEESTHAGRPAEGKDYAEEQGGEEGHLIADHGGIHTSAEKV